MGYIIQMHLFQIDEFIEQSYFTQANVGDLWQFQRDLYESKADQADNRFLATDLMENACIMHTSL